MIPKKTLLIEISIYAFIFTSVTAFLILSDASERFYRYSRKMEHLELDELLLSLPALLLCLTIFGFLRVRELKRLNRELSQSQAAMALAKAEAERLARENIKFLTTVCHELNSPLNGIVSTIDVAQASDEEEDRQTYLNLARESAFLLKGVINDVMEYSRLEHGQPLQPPKPFSPRRQIEAILDSQRQLTQEKGLALTLEMPDSAPQSVLGHEQLFRQIAMNLVGNAIKFTDKGEVSVRCLLEDEPDGARLVLDVEDSGPGIPEPMQNEIFRPFVQAGATGRTRHGGIGLGLSIVQRLAKAMGGRVSLRSVPGQGSTFRVSVPVLVENQPPSAGSPANT